LRYYKLNKPDFCSISGFCVLISAVGPKYIGGFCCHLPNCLKCCAIITKLSSHFRRATLAYYSGRDEIRSMPIIELVDYWELSGFIN
ncbi:MAG: hypothetical protein KAJ53_04865, partial [Anaerolineales bacterium]|nr:hypothetical protein [Anaerolineales bacterium]